MFLLSLSSSFHVKICLIKKVLFPEWENISSLLEIADKQQDLSMTSPMASSMLTKVKHYFFISCSSDLLLLIQTYENFSNQTRQSPRITHKIM